MASPAGLSVTVSPSASAFFAGEVFTASITFRNTATPAPSDDSTPHGLVKSTTGPPGLRTPSKGHARSASTANLSSWASPLNGGYGNGALPATPPRGGGPHAAGGPYGFASPQSSSYGRTVTSGHAPHPSLSASASTPYLPTTTAASSSGSPSSSSARRPPLSTGGPTSRTPSATGSFSTALGSYDPDSTVDLPTRKGLVGKKPPAPEPPFLPSSSGGLYSEGPRRPGSFRSGSSLGHARTQSMAVGSSPASLSERDASSRNVTAPPNRPGIPRRSNNVKGIVAAFEQMDGRQPRSPSDPRAPTTGTSEGTTEDSSPPITAQRPDFPDDAAFPVSQSSSAPAPSHFPRRPTFGHRRVPSNFPYASAGSRARLSTLSLASDGSESEDADDEDDGQGGVGNGFYGLGKNETMESVEEAKYASHARPVPRRLFSTPAGPSQQNGLAPPARPPARGHERNRSISYGNAPASDTPALTHPPNTIVLLWAFAHLEGSFEVDESLIKPAEFLEVKRLLVGGTGGVGLGGGTLEERKTGGGWREWLGWGGGGGGGGGGAASNGAASARSRGANATASNDNLRGGASLEERKKKVIEERSVPILSCPPSILAVDLVLKPGESKTFTFSLRVPADLPPSFRGKSIKFNYELVVGTNRTAVSPSMLVNPEQPLRPRSRGKASSSRVMKVPIRLYNHVGMTGARPFYDLTTPVIYQRDEAIVKDEVETKEKGVVKAVRRADTEKEDFENYAANLLSSVAIDSPEILQNASLSPTLQPVFSPPLLEAPPELRPEMGSHRGTGTVEGFGLEVDEADGCKAAVEIVSRNSQKVSYDINKDGNQVASLTLVKSAYRLGETVNGSVLINSGEGRVLRISARLETHELVETSIATMPAPKMRQITRRLHAEHHEMVLDSERIGFALAIPSGATPDFGTSGVKLQWTVRLSFLVIPPSPEGPAPAPIPRRGTPLGAPPSGESRSANGAATPPRAGHGRSRSFAYGFEPAVPLTLPPPPAIPPSGATHLMPVAPSPEDPHPPHNLSYRAVPDLGYVPVLFSSAVPDGPPAPGPLQKTASGAHHRPTPSISARPQSPFGNASAVLVPAKVETVECSIPIKVYPGNTPFRPTISIFEA
ncbi:hypothetical protein JCM10908_006436 [Rhodotorula pacifica]|uniref:uncharacterized protein n=1 Tax=Rhodotorula pacifica TaxID=1495444 RepID=UPI003172C14B